MHVFSNLRVLNSVGHLDYQEVLLDWTDTRMRRQQHSRSSLHYSVNETHNGPIRTLTLYKIVTTVLGL